MEFERRNQEYLRKKEEKLRMLQDQKDSESTFQPKLYKKRRSIGSGE